MSRKIMWLSLGIVFLLLSCADKGSPEYAVKNLINAVKNQDYQFISEIIDYDRILIQLKGEGYLYMLPEQKKVETDRLRDAMLESFKSGKLSIIKDITPIVEEVSVVDEEGFGPKARVVVTDKKDSGVKLVFHLSQVDGEWKIVYIGQSSA